MRPIHAKAMPVLLTTDDEWDIWFDGSVEEAMALQRPLPNDTLQIVATGEKSDRASSMKNAGVEFEQRVGLGRRERCDFGTNPETKI